MDSEPTSTINLVYDVSKGGSKHFRIYCSSAFEQAIYLCRASVSLSVLSEAIKGRDLIYFVHCCILRTRDSTWQDCFSGNI